MNLKLFDINEGLWIDVSGTPGASLEYNDVSGWVVGSGYKSYIAQLSQTGSNDPTAIVLQNNLGFVPDWKRDSGGIYGFNWDVDFNSDKCAIYLSPLYQFKAFYFDYTAEYDVTLYTASGDDYIDKTTVEIRYYN
jgi:hypothetical protein